MASKAPTILTSMTEYAGKILLRSSSNAFQKSLDLTNKSLFNLNRHRNKKYADRTIANVFSAQEFTPSPTLVDAELADLIGDQQQVDLGSISTMLYELQLGTVGQASVHFAEESKLISDSSREGLSRFIEGVIVPSHDALVENTPNPSWKFMKSVARYLPGQGIPAVAMGYYPHVSKDFIETLNHIRKTDEPVDPEAYMLSFSPIPTISMVNEGIAHEFDASPNLFMLGNQIGRILKGQDDPFIRDAREAAYLEAYAGTPQASDFKELLHLRKIGDPEITAKIRRAREEGQLIAAKLVEPTVRKAILKLMSSDEK